MSSVSIMNGERMDYFQADSTPEQAYPVWVRGTASNAEPPVGAFFSALLSSFFLQGNY